MKAFAATLAVAISVPVIAMDHDVTLRNSMDYVRSLQDNCIRTDGYKCADEGVVANLGNTLLPGNYLKAWSICYEDFLKIEDLAEEQKQLRHYNIRIVEDESHYLVEFLGLLLPYVEHGEPRDVIMGVFGRSVKYWVDKDTFEISKRLFYK